MYLFEATEEAAGISAWINNQHSDGVWMNEAKPIGIYGLPADKYSIDAVTLIDQETGRNGDEYDNYRLDISINDVTEEGAYNLAGFVAKDVFVHVLTNSESFFGDQ